MRRLTILGFVLLLTASLSHVAPAEEGSGGQAGAFLRVATGPRSVGLGGAFVAISDDASALQYNPAGLSQSAGFLAEASYSQASMDRTRYQAGTTFSNDGFGGIGVHMAGFGVTDIDGRDEFGNPTDTFDDSEVSMTLGYAKRLGDFIAVGASATYLSHELEQHSATGLAFGGGVLASYGVSDDFVRRLRVGASAAQIGGRLEWDTESGHEDELPITSRLGLAIDLAPGDAALTLSTQVTSVENMDVTSQYGAELTLMHALVLRGGWDGDRASFGAGIRAGSFRFDYAYYDDVLEEGATHWVGLVYAPQPGEKTSQSSIREATEPDAPDDKEDAETAPETPAPEDRPWWWGD